MTPEFTVVPRDLYYHEVAYVRRLESDKAALLAVLCRAVTDAEKAANPRSRFFLYDHAVAAITKARSESAP